MINVYVVVVEGGNGLEHDNSLIRSTIRYQEARRFVQTEQDTPCKRTSKILPVSLRAYRQA